MNARDLTPEQLDALRVFVRSFTAWKARLRKLWAAPHLFVDSPRTSALYSLRNTHGPSWLDSVKRRDLEKA